MTQLVEGDVVQIDRGPALVIRVTESGATVRRLNSEVKAVQFADSRTGEAVAFAPKSDGRDIHISGQVPKSRLLERRGEEGLTAFLQKGTTMNKNLVKLELGDRLCYRGSPATVVAVSEKSATVGLMDGREFKEKRVLNDIYFTDCVSNDIHRLDESERAENLKQFLAQRTPPQSESVNNSGDNKQTETTVMAKKGKGKKGAKSANGEVRKNPSYAGRGDLIGNRIEAGDTDAEIRLVIKEKYPTSSPSDVEKTIKAKRARAKADAAKAAKE